ncbi:MAG: hypothetical protein Q8K78_02825 [Planctomycetaceae bacterium]|nr:hypothetical protein [Planctomycetaceae bacterium]
METPLYRSVAAYPMMDNFEQFSGWGYSEIFGLSEQSRRVKKAGVAPEQVRKSFPTNTTEDDRNH